MRAGRPQRRTATAPSQRSRSADDARLVAFEVMRAIDDGAYANLELPRALRRAGLTGRDAAFVTELVYGATRLRGRYDPIIGRGAGRDVTDIDPEVLDVLRLGAHQLLGMRVDSYAAVDSSVALTRELLGTGRAGFVNAVLRRVSEKDPQQWRDILLKGVEPGSDEALAVSHSHPAWVVRALRAALEAHLGEDADSGGGIEALLEADNAPATVALVARPGLADVEELVAAGATRSQLSPIAALLESGGDPGRIAAVRSSRAAVQDEGSQLVALAALAAAAENGTVEARPTEPDGGQPLHEPDNDRPDEHRGDDEPTGEPEGARWLDLCAGPGGKAALLAAASIGAGATLFANDASEHRTRLVDQAVGAAIDAGADVFVGTGDGREIGEQEPDSFDLVLLDSPCTGLGALRRRPEARWRRSPEDVGSLSQLQGELLDSAVAATKPGGLIAYITCSPHPAETRFVVADAVARHENLEALDAQPYVRDASGQPVSDLGQAPYVQLWPHRHGTDAMFLALLRKRSAATASATS
nr:transcription antitermination factor NusB [Kineosphaera limosa]